MEAEPTKLSSYAKAFLELVGKQKGADQKPPLGNATRGQPNTSYIHPAHKFLLHLLENSPSPETIAEQFLMRLTNPKCKLTVATVTKIIAIVEGDRANADPVEWATGVDKELREKRGVITPIQDLGSFYMSQLVVAIRNPGGSPSAVMVKESDFGSLAYTRIQNILKLKPDIKREQEPLKRLVLARDGNKCLITDAPFEGEGEVEPQCAHIIPFSIQDKPLVLAAIEMFTGKKVMAETILELINNPRNAINLEMNTHHSMDKKLAWSIEAEEVLVEKKLHWKYYFRKIKDVPYTVKREDKEEIEFGRNIDSIMLPNPHFCNLHLAVARVFEASGFAEVIDQYQNDDENDPGITGDDFVEDFWRRLAAISVST